MKITKLKTNHKVNPIGYDFPYQRFDWMVTEAEGKEPRSVRIRICEVCADGTKLPFYDSGEVQPDAAGGLETELKTAAGTRYEW